jgi:hypothetical protein
VQEFNATLTLSTGAQYVILGLPPVPNFTFIGFVSTNPAVTISSLSFGDYEYYGGGGATADIGAIQYGSANPTFTPEPGLYAITALGMSGLIVFFRRNRKA